LPRGAGLRYPPRDFGVFLWFLQTRCLPPSVGAVVLYDGSWFPSPFSPSDCSVPDATPDFSLASLTWPKLASRTERSFSSISGGDLSTRGNQKTGVGYSVGCGICRAPDSLFFLPFFVFDVSFRSVSLVPRPPLLSPPFSLLAGETFPSRFFGTFFFRFPKVGHDLLKDNGRLRAVLLSAFL